MLGYGKRLLVLKELSIFREVEPQDYLKSLAANMDEVIFPANYTICKRGETDQVFYILVSGCVSVHVANVQLTTLSAGACFGETSLFDVQPRIASVTTLEESHCLLVNPQQFEQVISDVPKVGLSIARLLCERIRQLKELIQSSAQVVLIDELQQKTQELQALNLLKDDFLSTVSHELRSPMANIKMAVHMLQQFVTDPRQARYLKILDNECNRETELINDLLDLQRLETGVTSSGIETLHLLQDWLPSVVESFEARAQQRQQRLHVRTVAILPPLSSSRMALERILVELLTNACKYTPPAGEIFLEVRYTSSPQSLVSFKVSNPAEIPPTELPRIFDKFYRAPNADPWHQGGTGLGLALVQKLVEQLGGQISVKSLQGWTTFQLDVPQRSSAT